MAKKIVFLALNWGLGHICRLIPLIQQTKESEFKVVFAGSARQQHIISRHISDVELIDFPVASVRLSRGSTQIFKLFWQLPGFLLQVFREHRALKRLIRKEEIDLIISDSVYGAYHQSVPCVFLTHQLEIQVPSVTRFLTKPINHLNRYFLRKYSEVWVPDFAGTENLAGALSHPKISFENVHYIKPLSRFHGFESTQDIRSGRILAILSGPEPQRSIFEKKLIAQTSMLGLKEEFFLVRGLPGVNQHRGLNILNDPSDDELAHLILTAEIIISRSGYSSIMDLFYLGRTAFVVPTPGQTEQEYLASKLSKEGFLLAGEQKKFSIVQTITAMREFKARRWMDNEKGSPIVQERLGRLLND